MIVASLIFTIIAMFLPGVIAVIIDEIFDRPRTRDKVMIFGKIYVVGVTAAVFGFSIMSRESLLGENYFESLFEVHPNPDDLVLRYLPSLIASVPLALLFSLAWAWFFEGKTVNKFMTRIGPRGRRPNFEHAKDTGTFIKINNIKFVSIWDREFGQQITGEVERADEDEKMISFMLKNAIVYNSVGEEIRRAKMHKLVRRKNKLIVAFSKDKQLPGGRLRIQVKS